MLIGILLSLSSFICIFQRLLFFFTGIPEPVPDFFQAPVAAHADFFIVQSTYLNAGTLNHVFIVKHICLLKIKKAGIIILDGKIKENAL